MKVLDEYAKAIAANPFIKMEAELHVTFLGKVPDAKAVEALHKGDFAADSFVVKDDVVYLHIPERYSGSKLSNLFLEKNLKVQATTRNWKTCLALLELGKDC